jgi:hypothetical protein
MSEKEYEYDYEHIDEHEAIEAKKHGEDVQVVSECNAKHEHLWKSVNSSQGAHIFFDAGFQFRIRREKKVESVETIAKKYWTGNYEWLLELLAAHKAEILSEIKRELEAGK